VCAQTIDQNKDRFIDASDLAAYLASIGESIPGDTVRQMIAEADTDGDNKLSATEFSVIFRKIEGVA
jgi:Ca2+-binding EF-hand superfamily protein